MSKRVLTSITAAAVLAAPAVATADKPDKPKPPKPDTAYNCTPKTVGLNARGVFVSHTLEQTKGADTKRKGDDRYSGTVTLDVKKANHKAATGEQTVTLTDGRVRFYGKGAEPVAGDKVKLTGKITKLAKKCDATGFEPTLTAKKVDFSKAKKA